MRAIVRKQSSAGIDVGNNGEAAARSVLPLSQAAAVGARRQLGAAVARRRRPLSGVQADVDRAARQQDPGLVARRPAEAIGDIRYLDERAINDECRDFNAVLKENLDVFAEPSHERPLARHPRHRGEERALRQPGELSRGARCGVAGRLSTWWRTGWPPS